MGLFFWLIFPGAVLLVLECLIVALTYTQRGCFVIPALAGAALAFTIIAGSFATGWDGLGWGILSMSAGTGLLGSLLGLGIGILFRRLRRRSLMKKQTKLYNIILPIWLLVLFPQVWLIVVPGNLIIDCAVLLLTLCALKHRAKKDVLKKVWWKLWLLGFAADAVGVVWLLLGMVPATGWLPMSASFVTLWNDTVGNITGRVFSHWASFLWMLIGVALAGLCIYFFDKRALRSCGLLTDREKHIVALAMAIVTAPWTFFIPMY